MYHVGSLEEADSRSATSWYQYYYSSYAAFRQSQVTRTSKEAELGNSGQSGCTCTFTDNPDTSGTNVLHIARCRLTGLVALELVISSTTPNASNVLFR